MGLLKMPTKTFTHKVINGVRSWVVVTWTQRRCVKCKRFISGHKQKYCSECREIVVKEQQTKADKNWKISHREKYNKYHRELRLRVKRIDA
jgi:predicted nucleic acid-binding Zn ribbon protein